jgi:hypothetical protein
MGLMDKVKQQAEQALAKAQQGVSQGQAKLGDLQAKRRSDALLRDLGAAYYAEQRQGGPHDPVVSALAALDEHAKQNGPIDTAAQPDDVAAAPSSDEPAAASYTLDDVAAAPSSDEPAAASYTLDDVN